MILFQALILFFPWFDVILISWVLSSCFHLVNGETRVFHSFISFNHHFLFPLLLHFSSTTLLPSFLSIYNCHYPFFFSKWHFEFALLIGWLDWAPSCSSQTASLYLLCRTGPSCRDQHLIFLLFLYLKWHFKFAMPIAYSALSASWLTCYDCPVPLLVHQDNLSLSSYQHFLCVAVRH